MHKKLRISIKMALAYDSGNLLIKHNDKWRGDYYLKEDLSFTTDKSLAARFYLLKSGDTPILNGDRISINSGNRTLVIDNENHIRLLDRDQQSREINTFIITNGTDTTDPITYDGGIFFISDKTQKQALKYVWGMELIGNSPDAVVSDASNYKPHDHPSLVNENYGTACEAYINAFQFQLERAGVPIMTMQDTKTEATPSNKLISQTGNFLDRYKGAILLLLLMVVLILCIAVSK